MDTELKALLVEQETVRDTLKETELGKRKLSEAFTSSFCQWDEEYPAFMGLSWDVATEMIKTSDNSCQTECTTSDNSCQTECTTSDNSCQTECKMVSVSTQTVHITPPKPPLFDEKAELSICTIPST